MGQTRCRFAFRQSGYTSAPVTCLAWWLSSSVSEFLSKEADLGSKVRLFCQPPGTENAGALTPERKSDRMV